MVLISPKLDLDCIMILDFFFLKDEGLNVQLHQNVH